VESAPSQGATFEIYLPSSTKRAASPGGENAPKSTPGGNETILVVEDETGVRELASEFLKTGGYTVLVASDGVAALKLNMEHAGPIHLLLTDMVMPRMNGKELAQKVSETRPKIQVVFMTGYAEFPEKNGGKTSPSERILQKPFSRATLLEMVRQAVGAAPIAKLHETEVGGPA